MPWSARKQPLCPETRTPALHYVAVCTHILRTQEVPVLYYMTSSCSSMLQ